MMGYENKENRVRRVEVRFTQEEYNRAAEKAMGAGLSFSEYVRRCVLNRRIASKVELRTLSAERNILAELRKQGGLMKLIHNETRGTYSQETAETIRALGSCARVLERKIHESQERLLGNMIASPSEQLEKI